jgi:Tol biopolymer transport system component
MDYQPETTELAKAIALVKAGQSEEARPMLVNIVQADTRNISAWLWLAQTLSDNAERIQALESCLKFNPGEGRVVQALEKLRARQRGFTSIGERAPQSRWGEAAEGNIPPSMQTTRRESPGSSLLPTRKQKAIKLKLPWARKRKKAKKAKRESQPVDAEIYIGIALLVLVAGVVGAYFFLPGFQDLIGSLFNLNARQALDAAIQTQIAALTAQAPGTPSPAPGTATPTPDVIATQRALLTSSGLVVQYFDEAEGCRINFVTLDGKWVVSGTVAEDLCHGNDPLQRRWSPDRTQFTFVAQDEEASRNSGFPVEKIYIVDQFGRSVNLVKSTFAPVEEVTWSPDSNKLAYIAPISGGPAQNRLMALYIIARDGTSEARLTGENINLTSTKPVIGRVAWSPDGSRLAFVAIQTDGSGSGLFVANADGTGQEQLSIYADPSSPVHWSPDGTRLLFLESIGGAGQATWAITDMDGVVLAHLSNCLDRDAAWSPDGSVIACTDLEANLSLVGIGGLGLSMLDTGPFSLQNPPSGLTWSPDGSWLAFLDRNTLYAIHRDSLNKFTLSNGLVGSFVWLNRSP